MTKTILLATTTLAILTLPAVACAATEPSTPGQAGPEQAAVAPALTGPTNQAPLVDTAQRGVLVFTPDFFADQRPNTALDMVDRVPGFDLDDGDGGRGFEGAVGNALINGSRPASKTDTGSNALNRTQAAQVERVELIRGGAPGIDMQGYPVVVNVVLSTDTNVEHSLQTDAVLFEGSANDNYGFRYQFTSRAGDRTFSAVVADGISMSDSNGPGTNVIRDGDGDLILAEDYVNDQWGGAAAVRLNYAGPFLGGKIDATTRYGVDDFNSFDLFTTDGSRRLETYVSDSSALEFGATYTRPLAAGLGMELRLIHEQSEFDDGSAYDAQAGGVEEPALSFTSTGDQSESILRGLLRWERSESLTFEGGAEVAYNMLDTTQALSVGGVAVPLPSATVKVEETRGEIFGKSTWRVSPTLSVEGGVRLERSTISQSGGADSERTFDFMKPRLQATWTPWADNQFRIRFEREVGQLDFGDFAASADLSEDDVLGGNVNLSPEERWVAEASYERRFWGEGVVSITYRHDEIRNAIDRIPLEDGLSAVGNIGDGTLDKLSLNVVVPLDRWGMSGGKFAFENEWNHTEVTDPTTGATRSASDLRASQPNFSLTQDIPSWKINYRLTYLPIIKQYTYGPDQIFGFEGHDYWEAEVEYKPAATWTLTAKLNIWDDFDFYRIAYADRSPPRTIAQTELREIDPRTFVSLTVRKTF